MTYTALVLPLPANVGNVSTGAYGISNSSLPIIVGATDRAAVFWRIIKGVGPISVRIKATLLAGPPGTIPASTAYSVNKHGLIAGEKGFEAWIWKINPTTGLVTSSLGLGHLPPPHNEMSRATMVSDDDAVVGHSDQFNNAGIWEKGFYWKQSSGMIDLGFIPGPGNISMALGIGKTIVGFGNTNSRSATQAEGPDIAIVWTAPASNTINFLNTPSGFQWEMSYANAVNEHGSIVGYGVCTADQKNHAILWNPVIGGYVSSDLGLPPGCEESQGVDINSSGTMLIAAKKTTGLHKAFLKTSSGNWVSLKAPTGFSNKDVYPTAINNAGLIVGYSGLSAILWVPK